MREIIKIMKNWNFTDQNGKVSQLDLPHTWNNKDGQDGGNDYWRGKLGIIQSKKSISNVK